MVAFSRAEDFYHQHHDSLGKILNPKEEEALKKSVNPGRLLAYLFSAKEAVFKSLDLNWLGVEGFRMIEVDLSSEEEKFSEARLSGILKEKVAGRFCEWHLNFFEVRDSVIAQAISF